jgi:hypothetical protein
MTLHTWLENGGKSSSSIWIDAVIICVVAAVKKAVFPPVIHATIPFRIWCSM